MLVHNYYQQWGGEDVYFESLKQLLIKNGIFLSSFIKKSEDINSFNKKLLTLRDMTLGTTQNELNFNDTLLKNKPDLVHFNNIFPLITMDAYDICKKNNIPIIQTIQTYRLLCPKGTLYRDNKICENCIFEKYKYSSIVYGCYHNSRVASFGLSNSLFRAELKKSLEKVSLFHFTSKFIRDFHVKHLSIPFYKTFVLPSFVDTKSFSNNKEKEKIKFKEYFLFVGRLAEEKGIIELLEFFKRNKKLNLIVIGDGPLKFKVGKYRSENIMVKGFLNRTKILEYMKECKAVIIPSPWYEVCPTVLIEAYSQSCPVVVPKFGAFKNLVTQDKTGFFYQRNNYDSLLKTLQSLNKNNLENLKKEVNKEFQIKYSGEVHYQSLYKKYKQLIRL